MYIYVYIYICVCVYIYIIWRQPSKFTWLTPDNIYIHTHIYNGINTIIKNLFYIF